MKEIIQQVLREEEEARRRVEDAQAQADKIVQEAEREAEALIADLVTKAREGGEHKSAQLQAEFIAEKEKTLAAVKTEVANLRKNRQNGIPDIARKVFAQIVNIEE